MKKAIKKTKTAVPEITTCEACQGKGRVSDKQSCEVCEGTGVQK